MAGVLGGTDFGAYGEARWRWDMEISAYPGRLPLRGVGKSSLLVRVPEDIREVPTFELCLPRRK